MIDFVTTGCTKITSTAATSATAPIPLDSAGTVPKYVVFKSTATGYVRMSEDGSAATNADVMVTPGDSLRMCTNRRSFVSFVADSGNASLQIEPLEFGGYQLADALAVLAKYGTNAHVYLPGIGTISGLTAGNYLDSAGVTAASVDNPVGLSLDALQAMTLGSELVTNGGFAAVPNGTDVTALPGWSAYGTPTNRDIQSESLRITANAANQGAILTVSVVAGKTYLLTFDVSTTYANLYFGSANFNTDVTVGTGRTVVFKPVGASETIYFRPNGNTGTGTSNFDNISVREIPGIHATQATTANKPILRLNSGKYSWQFDGVNDSLALSAPLFQMSDDHAVIAGCSPSSFAGSFKTVFGQGGATSTPRAPELGFNNAGNVFANWADDSAVSPTLLSTSTYGASINLVVSAIKQTNAKRLRVNGVQQGSVNNTVLGATTLTGAAIGVTGATTPYDYFQGSIGPVIAIKATISDSDLLTLERFVGQLSGVSL